MCQKSATPFYFKQLWSLTRSSPHFYHSVGNNTGIKTLWHPAGYLSYGHFKNNKVLITYFPHLMHFCCHGSKSSHQRTYCCNCYSYSRIQLCKALFHNVHSSVSMAAFCPISSNLPAVVNLRVSGMELQLGLHWEMEARIIKASEDTTWWTSHLQ